MASRRAVKGTSQNFWREDFARCAAGHCQVRVKQMDAAEVSVHQVEIVHGREDRDAFTPQEMQKIDKLDLAADVEVLRRFVEQQQLGLLRQAECDLDPLPLSARELVEDAIAKAEDVSKVECAIDRTSGLRAEARAVSRDTGRGLARRSAEPCSRRESRVVEALAQPCVSARGCDSSASGWPSIRTSTARRHQTARGKPQQRRLARAVRSDQSRAAFRLERKSMSRRMSRAPIVENSRSRIRAAASYDVLPLVLSQQIEEERSAEEDHQYSDRNLRRCKYRACERICEDKEDGAGNGGNREQTYVVRAEEKPRDMRHDEARKADEPAERDGDSGEQRARPE